MYTVSFLFCGTTGRRLQHSDSFCLGDHQVYKFPFCIAIPPGIASSPSGWTETQMMSLVANLSMNSWHGQKRKIHSWRCQGICIWYLGCMTNGSDLSQHVPSQFWSLHWDMAKPPAQLNFKNQNLCKKTENAERNRQCPPNRSKKLPKFQSDGWKDRNGGWNNHQSLGPLSIRIQTVSCSGFNHCFL